MKRKLILVEGAICCPINEIYKIAYKYGYETKICWNFDKFKKQGEVPLSTFRAIFIGPRPHNIKKGGSKNLQMLHGTVYEGTKLFVCSELTQNKTIKITKSSFKRAFLKFLHSEK
ncbi:MAG: hypothetical protein LBG59_04820 [Candidatus Peribacteria bacterium]|jgi:hypothetical protein|nr:hypothetical protein [Candidatus Peribacteria bacterium]